ncbi:MAG: S1 RNA-binding domain-containing protein [Chloroflexota bacterium]
MTGQDNPEEVPNGETPATESVEDPITPETPVEAEPTANVTDETPVESVSEVVADEGVADESVVEQPVTEADTPADDEQSEPDETISNEEPESSAPQSEGGEGKPEKQEPRTTHKRSQYKRGEIIEVKVIESSPTSITVELDERGDGFTGVIPTRELERMTEDMLEMLKPDETVKLYVVNHGNQNGEVVLSLNRALEELDWENAEAYRQSREIYEGFIGGYNKGGLIVRFGRLRGFIPQSQISDERRARVEGDTPESRWGDMIREPIMVKIIEVDRSRNRLILSERAATRETREARKAKLIEELTLNEVRTGRVVSLEDFGAFVDIGGAEGLIHVTELSWGHVTHPRQVLDVGQEVTVEVINVDAKRKRIGLSLKRQLTDPWDIVASNYQQGQLVKAVVTKLTKFGAFARLSKQEEVEGLIHISELSENRVAHPREVVDVGEELTLRIVKIDVADRRLGLSLKAVNSTEYLDSDMDFLFEDSDQ